MSWPPLSGWRSCCSVSSCFRSWMGLGSRSLRSSAGSSSGTGSSIVWSLSPTARGSTSTAGSSTSRSALLGVSLGPPRRRSVRVVALGLLGLFGAALLWALLGKVIPNLVPDGERIARLREPLDYWNALALVGAMTLPLALWAAVRREHPLLVRVASVVVGFAAVVVGAAHVFAGGVVVALLAPAAYITHSQTGRGDSGACRGSGPGRLALLLGVSAARSRRGRPGLRRAAARGALVRDRPSAGGCRCGGVACPE